VAVNDRAMAIVDETSGIHPSIAATCQADNSVTVTASTSSTRVPPPSPAPVMIDTHSLRHWMFSVIAATSPNNQTLHMVVVSHRQSMTVRKSPKAGKLFCFSFPRGECGNPSAHSPVVAHIRRAPSDSLFWQDVQYNIVTLDDVSPSSLRRSI
jgi:hypothetical protein